jgi:energy-coupling factor transport system permease protein
VIATHRRRASPLHATRAGIAAAWCTTLGLAALSFEHPLLLAAVLAVTLVAAAGAHVRSEVARALAWSLPLALAIALVNAIVVRDGVTVVFRGGSLPGIGRLDITAEALAYGGMLATRAMAIFACAALLAAVVDPDELLRAVRRRSLRTLTGGVTSTATRLGVVRAVAAGALDRATDVAATLEVRGFASGGRPARLRRPLSRHDLAFAVSALGLAALAIASGVGGWEAFEAYPRLVVPVEARQIVLAVALAALALLPFTDRRGIA